MRRFLVIATLILVVGGVVGALTFPTDALVRAALDRVSLPDHMQLTFEAAHLRPNGLRLEQVHVVRPNGRPAFDAEWVRLWPSLWGLWRDRTGRPWTIAASTCQGTIEVEIGVEPRGTPITVSLEHVEIASCLPYVLPQVEAYGRVDGRGHVVLGGPDRPASEGRLELRGAAWTPGGPLDDLPLRADAATLAGRLADGRLELTSLDATSSDFDVKGAGVARLLAGLDDSVLDLRIAMTPGRTMSPLLRRYLDAIAGPAPAAPAARGTRTFRVQGTLRDPRLIAIATP